MRRVRPLFRLSCKIFEKLHDDIFLVNYCEQLLEFYNYLLFDLRAILGANALARMTVSSGGGPFNGCPLMTIVSPESTCNTKK